MRDEKEERKKQARSIVHVHVHVVQVVSGLLGTAECSTTCSVMTAVRICYVSLN